MPTVKHLTASAEKTAGAKPGLSGHQELAHYSSPPTSLSPLSDGHSFLSHPVCPENGRLQAEMLTAPFALLLMPRAIPSSARSEFITVNECITLNTKLGQETF